MSIASCSDQIVKHFNPDIGAFIFLSAPPLWKADSGSLVFFVVSTFKVCIGGVVGSFEKISQQPKLQCQRLSPIGVGGGGAGGVAEKNGMYLSCTMGI